MKRFLAIVLALAMVFALCACGGNDNTNETDKPDTAAYKVAMITDYGDITDQSFNQTTYEACKAFCDKNSVEFKYYKPTADSTAARVEMVEQAVAEGFNVIVMPGFAFAGTIAECQDTYPDVKFIGLDVSEFDLYDSFYNHDKDNNRTDLKDPNNKEHISKNVYCAVYQEELCGYMAGYAAVKLGYTKLGFLGGMAVPAVIRYGYGFVQGANAAAVELDTKIEINYVYGGQFQGDADITAKMDTWYANGTEVVFACGGGIYTSAAEAAAKVNAKVIGVDVDQAGIIDGDYGDGITVTSAMKGLYPATYDTLTDVIVNGKWADYVGKIETLGLVSGDDPTLNYVQIPMDSTQWDDNFTKDDYKALVKAMFDGTVKVSNDTTAMPAVDENHTTVSDQGKIK